QQVHWSTDRAFCPHPVDVERIRCLWPSASSRDFRTGPSLDSSWTTVSWATSFRNRVSGDANPSLERCPSVIGPIVPKASVKRVARRARAERDIDEAAAHYRAEGGSELELRFIDALEAAIRQTAAHPALGSPRYAAELKSQDL